MPESDFIRALRGQSGPLPPGPRVLPAEMVGSVHRSRLIAGMAEAAAGKGYAATTIADVVSRAQVSRRTFYEQFEDKDACFLATYDASAEVAMAFIAEAVESAAPNWHERISAGISAYLGILASEPALTRVLLVEILATGPKALEHRRAAHRRFAELICGLVEAHSDELPADRSLDLTTATAIVGAIHELILVAVEEDRTADLQRLTVTMVELVEAALTVPGARASAASAGAG